MKRPALKSALQSAASSGRRAVAAAGTPSREGKRQIAAFFAPEVGRALKGLAANEDSTVQALMREALNDLFAKRGKPPIA
jgi:hypothetical protein